jgi:transcriptional regulator with XRE-family HTH domain
MHRLRTLRLEQALTQAELAKEAGVSEFTVLRLEQCKGRPYPTTIRKLAKALGVEPKALVNCGPPADAGTAD